jgi:hypothetical protein
VLIVPAVQPTYIYTCRPIYPHEQIRGDEVSDDEEALFDRGPDEFEIIEMR